MYEIYAGFYRELPVGFYRKRSPYEFLYILQNICLITCRFTEELSPAGFVGN